MKKHVCQRSELDQALIGDLEGLIDSQAQQIQKHKCPVQTKEIDKPVFVPMPASWPGWLSIIFLALIIIVVSVTPVVIDRKLQLTQATVDFNLAYVDGLKGIMENQCRDRMNKPIMVELLEAISADIENGHTTRADKLVHRAKEMVNE